MLNGQWDLQSMHSKILLILLMELFFRKPIIISICKCSVDRLQIFCLLIKSLNLNIFIMNMYPHIVDTK